MGKFSDNCKNNSLVHCLYRNFNSDYANWIFYYCRQDDRGLKPEGTYDEITEKAEKITKEYVEN